MPETPSQWVWLARIRRTQGRKGEVFAEILTDFPEKFEERKRLWLIAANDASREVELIAHWLHKGGIVLHFAGVDSISAAELLAGMIVAIPSAERAALEDDETYISDLIGCVLVDLGAAPVEVGTIDDVDRGPERRRCWWCAAQAAKCSFRLRRVYLRSIDLEAKRVEWRCRKGWSI